MLTRLLQDLKAAHKGPLFIIIKVSLSGLQLAFLHDETSPYIRSFRHNALPFIGSNPPIPNAYIPPLISCWTQSHDRAWAALEVRWAGGGGRHNEGLNDLPLDVWLPFNRVCWSLLLTLYFSAYIASIAAFYLSLLRVLHRLVGLSVQQYICYSVYNIGFRAGRKGRVIPQLTCVLASTAIGLRKHRIPSDLRS